MKDYFKRNSPIFYIALFTIILFIAIIIAGGTKPTNSPNLQIVQDSDLFTEQNPIVGDKNARVTIVEFMDYNCPACAAVNPLLKAAVNNNPGKVRLIIRHLPLNIPGHESSRDAALAATASNKFNIFKEFHEEIFNLNVINRDNLIAIAEKYKINRDEFIKEMESEVTKNIVDRDMSDAAKLNLRGTPSIFINGRQFDNSTDLSVMIQTEVNRLYPQN